MVDVRDDGALPEDSPQSVYITYDGLLEPMGRSQVAPYVCALARAGVRAHVVSFEKPFDLADPEKAQALRSSLDGHGVGWTPLKYHKHPRVAATLLDVLIGSITAVRVARAHRAHVVHGRSYVAGLMAWAVKLGCGSRLVFDMRGFWPEERVELGLFPPHGLLYRLSKRCEHFLLRTADHVVVLTESAKAILRDREASLRMSGVRDVPEKPITVIPCCTDLERFRPAPPDRELVKRHGLDGKLLIGNIGAVNDRYMLAEMFRFAFHVKSHRPATQFVYLTQQDGARVRAAARDAGLRDEDVFVLSVAPDDVPRWLSTLRLGVFFLRPSYAAKASSYTKLAEFLACGVPVVTNKGVGDVDKILGSSRCGVLVAGMRESDLASAARQVLPLLDGDSCPEDVRANCRATAARYFSLDDGAQRYLSIYRGLAFPQEKEPRTSVAVELS